MDLIALIKNWVDRQITKKGPKKFVDSVNGF